jgi:hypothetical protein
MWNWKRIRKRNRVESKEMTGCWVCSPRDKHQLDFSLDLAFLSRNIIAMFLAFDTQLKNPRNVRRGDLSWRPKGNSGQFLVVQLMTVRRPQNSNERRKLGSSGGRRQQSRTTSTYEENGTEGGPVHPQPELVMTKWSAFWMKLSTFDERISFLRWLNGILR